MEQLAHFELAFTVDDILRGQGMDPKTVRARKPILAAAAKRARAEGQGLVHPVALIREIIVRERRHERILLENGAALTGPLAARHLGGAERVAAVVCTIGPELEQAATRLLDEDPALAMALDGLGNAAVEILAQQVCEQIRERAQADGLQTSTPLSPGAPEWPVEIGQPQIFGLIEAAQAGIQITSGGMMIPKKSISFVVGIGAEVFQADLCEVCNLKETCHYRHA